MLHITPRSVPVRRKRSAVSSKLVRTFKAVATIRHPIVVTAACEIVPLRQPMDGWRFADNMLLTRS